MKFKTIMGRFPRKSKPNTFPRTKPVSDWAFCIMQLATPPPWAGPQAFSPNEANVRLGALRQCDGRILLAPHGRTRFPRTKPLSNWALSVDAIGEFSSGDIDAHVFPEQSQLRPSRCHPMN
jgi:hypothetical protein